MQVKDEGRDFEPIPTGGQQAVCSGNYNLGMQPGFAGKMQHKVALVWELDELRKEGEFAGERFIVCKTYNATLNERSNLSKDLESWRGRGFTKEEREGFELDAVVNTNCNLNMVAKTNDSGKTYVNIAGITGLQKGQSKMKVMKPGYVPKWIEAMITGNNGAPSPDDFHDDIPF
ncbi:hypothetical protein LCGC14_1396000 [marine sediment metagenome]|uniref:DUF669 domain-containing protein n=1 Tax=marine sediment metagenome TaxID=412755 RepID=A0A0F9N024_9ZZZZ